MSVVSTLALHSKTRTYSLASTVWRIALKGRWSGAIHQSKRDKIWIKSAFQRTNFKWWRGHWWKWIQEPGMDKSALENVSQSWTIFELSSTVWVQRKTEWVAKWQTPNAKRWLSSEQKQTQKIFPKCFDIVHEPHYSNSSELEQSLE